ncbi:MAG: flagellar basal body P-ring formation protein FlgA [Pseudomonadota bacterium]|nr:flagellar basal body P-ring formation protein FlgA [Pseudomonadota bacterium]MDE3038176.1 flagellar basal body P-ring formation protein FlgA [Pseudomonadota bacterium]
MKITTLIITGIVAAMLALPAYAAAPVAASSPMFRLSYEDAEQAVSLALAEKGAGAKIAAIMQGRQPGHPLYSYGKPVAVSVRGLQFNKKTKQWSASLLFVADGDVVSAMPICGRYDEMIEVPVLKREVVHGDVIANQDVELRDFPVGQTRTDTVTDISDVIGKSPVRGVSPGRPIRESEIANPAVIRKNAVVQMRYTSPGMEITATGQALKEGAKGDVITVKNTSSRRVVRAVVADAGTVDVLTPDMTTVEASHD